MCVRGSGVVMEQSRPERDVTQQWDPVAPAPSLCTHIHTGILTHTTITYSKNLASNATIRVMFNLKDKDILCLFQEKDS